MTTPRTFCHQCTKVSYSNIVSAIFFGNTIFIDYRISYSQLQTKLNISFIKLEYRLNQEPHLTSVQRLNVLSWPTAAEVGMAQSEEFSSSC